MRKPVAVSSLLAVLLLAGCSTTQQTTAEACQAVTTSWDEFEAFAQTPGRDDAAMVEKREQMLGAWRDAVDGAPAWTQTAVGVAVDGMKKFSDGGLSMADLTSLYSLVASQVDVFRVQCDSDGNL